MQITPGMIAQQFDFEGPMKTLVFALGLWVKRARVRDAHAQPEEPNCELCPATAPFDVDAPGVAVIHGHAPRQSIATKDCGQSILHGLMAFVSAGT